MRDRRLEQNIVRVEAFIDQWKRLSQFLDRGMRGDNFSDEEEGAFLELKSEIAQEHQVLMTTLGSEGERSDRALRLLSSVPSLGALRELEDGADKRLSNDWHSTYLQLQALLGRLKGRKVQLASMSTFRVALRNVFTHPAVIICLLLLAIYGAWEFGRTVAPKLIEQWETRHD